MGFYLEESHIEKGGLHLRMKMSVYNELTRDGMISSSFYVLAARLLGLSYPDFLIKLHQDYDASISMDGGVYKSFLFKDKKKARQLVKELNERWEYILSQRP